MSTLPPNSTPSPHVEKLLEAANSASQTVAALHVAFMAFAAYLGVIIWGTTHEDLLRISPVKLPILDVELPLTTFYACVPWLLVLLHFNLLMQLELLSRKLWNLDRDLPATPAGLQIRDRLFIFPFTHLIAGRSNVRLIRGLLSLVVGITVIALPLFMLLAAQIRFLPFHDEGITWSQRGAVWADVLMLLALWPLIASANDNWWDWWRNLGYRLLGCWFAWVSYGLIILWNWLVRWFPVSPSARPINAAEAKGMIVLLCSVLVVFPLSIIAVIPGSLTIEDIYPSKNTAPEDTSKEKDKPEDEPSYFENRLIRYMPKSWLRFVDRQYYHQYMSSSDTRICKGFNDKSSYIINQQVTLAFTCELFDAGLFPRNLNLKEALLVPKDMSLSLLARATDNDETVREIAFKEFDGLKLQRRDLRFANLSEAVLLKADLRKTKLQSANLRGAKLHGKYLREAQLQGADLREVQLQGESLYKAKLQGVRLGGGVLNGEYLYGAQLQGAHLDGAHLQGAYLEGVKLQGAYLHGAQLQGADLSGAQLQGANLVEANLQGANLVEAQLQGEHMSGVQLQGANLTGAKLQGVDWSYANLDSVFIERIWPPLPFGSPKSQAGCYSENPTLLHGEYSDKKQLTSYCIKLFQKLIELACSDIAIAEGIARRGSERQINDKPDFGLAAALLKELDNPKPCTGLAGLSKETRKKLQKEATRQQTEKDN